MRSLILITCALALPLAACEAFTTGTVPAPSTISDRTKADEQAAVTAHLAYKSWRLAVETGVKSGLIKGTLAGRVADLDNQIFKALSAVDAAYSGGNAADIYTAVGNFNTAVTVGYSAIGGR